MSAGFEEDRHHTVSFFDRDRLYLQASASRDITPRFNARVQASLYSSDYDSAAQDDDETQYGIYLSWNVSGRLYILLDGEHFNRDSSNLLSEYDETRAFLRLAWRNTGGGSGAR